MTGFSTRRHLCHLNTWVCFNVRGSAAFHAWYYLPSLLNPWDRMVSYGWEDTEEWFVSCCAAGSARTGSMTLSHFITPCIPFSTCNLGPWYTNNLRNGSWSALLSIRWCCCCCLSALLPQQFLVLVCCCSTHSWFCALLLQMQASSKRAYRTMEFCF